MDHSLSATDRIRLTMLAGVLLRCFVITVVSLLFVWGVMFVAGDPIHRLHTAMFDLSRREFDLYVFGFLTLIKCLNVVLFLFPWLAITHYLRTSVIDSSHEMEFPARSGSTAQSMRNSL